MIGRARLEFFFFLDYRRRRRDNHLFYLVNAAAFFAAFFFENKSVLLRNLRRDIRLDRLVGVYENVEIVHQLLDELEIFQPELRRQILHDDRRLDVNDVLRLLPRVGGAVSAAGPSVDATAAASAAGTAGAGGGSTGAGGAAGPGFAISFEIGGKIVVLTLVTAVCLAFGFRFIDQRNRFHLLADLRLFVSFLAALRQ